MKAATVHLGFEVGSGEPVSVPLLNMAVTGQPQESGKTTALEALATRSGARVLTFVTKRGEGAFVGGRRVQPYFRDRADWQFVMGLIETMMREKNKFLRQYVIPLCRSTKTLKDVKAACLHKIGKSEAGIYVEINAYLDLILPEIARVELAPTLDLRAGLNVMDVANFITPMQMLFVQSAIDWINERERDVVLVMPEAWEMIPQGRGTPVKASAEQLARKGSAIGNRIWLDSQDMRGVDKTIIGLCPVWLVGVQREANEIKRNIANIPPPTGKPRPGDVAMLELGQFFACFHKTLAKVYVQPAWMDAADARSIALGDTTIGAPRRPPQPEEGQVKESEARALREQNATLKGQVSSLELQVDELRQEVGRLRAPQYAPPPESPHPDHRSAAPLSADHDYESLKRRLLADAEVGAALLKLSRARPEIEVAVTRKTIQMSEDNAQGKCAILISEGFFDDGQTGHAAFVEMKRRNTGVAKPTVYQALDKIAALGFLTKESDGYKAVPGMKVNIVGG